MQATGIVAEYNPFHNGHLYHVEQSRLRTGQPLIAVMSGSFMQRGEPALLSKWQRARLAVLGGVDLVLELPCVFTLRSAEFFARGAVALLAATGCCSALSCGVESPQSDFATLASLANRSETQAALQALLRSGKSYAASWQELLSAEGSTAAALCQPNDILALEYTKALQHTQAAIKPLYLHRTDAGYNSAELGSLASASAIRQSLASGSAAWQQAVPAPTRQALTELEGHGPDSELFWRLVQYRLLLSSPQQLAERCQCSEGLEHLLLQAADCASLAEALRHCSQKRYPTSRLRRLLCQLLLDAPRAVWETQAPAYLRVLAFNDVGRQLLKQMRQTAQLPLLTKPGRRGAADLGAQAQQQWQLETAATDLWSLLQTEPSLRRRGNDYYFAPVYVR